MTSVTRIGLILVLACVGFAAAHAAPATYQVTGNVSNSCTLSATSVPVTVSRSGNAGNLSIVFSTSPTNVTAFCNVASGGKLSFSSTRLLRQGNNYDYTLTVSGWGTGSAS